MPRGRFLFAFAFAASIGLGVALDPDEETCRGGTCAEEAVLLQTAAKSEASDAALQQLASTSQEAALVQPEAESETKAYAKKVIIRCQDSDATLQSRSSGHSQVPWEDGLQTKCQGATGCAVRCSTGEPIFQLSSELSLALADDKKAAGLKCSVGETMFYGLELVGGRPGESTYALVPFTSCGGMQYRITRPATGDLLTDGRNIFVESGPTLKMDVNLFGTNQYEAFFECGSTGSVGDGLQVKNQGILCPGKKLMVDLRAIYQP